MSHRHERGLERLVDRRTVHDEQRPRRRQGDQIQLILHAEEERAFGASKQPAEIERPRTPALEVGRKAGRIHEGVEGVACVATGDLGPRVGIADQLAIDATFQ